MADPVVQQITQSQTSIPDYARPYVEDLLGNAQAQTNLSQNPYMQYQGDRIAQYSPLQQQSFENAALLKASPQLQDAAALAGKAGLAALNTQYTATPYKAQQVAASYKFDPYKATQVSAPTIGPAAQMQAASTAYKPELTAYQMDQLEKLRTGSILDTEGGVQRYMSPYMQNVVDVQQREAKRQAAIQDQLLGAQAARAGAFGGSGDALQRAQAAANLQRNLAGIQATGQQMAYQQGMQQYNVEQQQALQAAMANQQAEYNVGAQNLAAKLGVQQLGTQTGLQVALANLSAEQQARVQNQAAQLQMQGLSAQQALQAAMANQQANQAAAQLNAQQGQFGADLGLRSAMANQQAAQQAAQLNAQQQQFGAGLGLQGLQAAMQGASQLANIGTQQFGQSKEIINLQNAMGAQQQQQAQNVLNTQYQDYLNQQNAPYKQIGFMSDLLRGLPLTQQSSTVYGAAPSATSQLVGLGTAGLGLSKLSGLKEGGLAKLAYMKIAEGAA